MEAMGRSPFAVWRGVANCTESAHIEVKLLIYIMFVMPAEGLEPPTNGLQNEHLTLWRSAAHSG